MMNSGFKAAILPDTTLSIKVAGWITVNPASTAASFIGGGVSLWPLPFILSVCVTTRLISSLDLIKALSEETANSGVPKNTMDKSAPEGEMPGGLVTDVPTIP